MKFKKNNKLDWSNITINQAEAFIEFLEIERKRHQYAIVEARDIIYAEEWWKRSPDLDATVELWNTAIKRHEIDIEDIEHLIIMVKHWYEI